MTNRGRRPGRISAARLSRRRKDGNRCASRKEGLVQYWAGRGRFPGAGEGRGRGGGGRVAHSEKGRRPKHKQHFGQLFDRLRAGVPPKQAIATRRVGRVTLRGVKPFFARMPAKVEREQSGEAPGRGQNVMVRVPNE